MTKKWQNWVEQCESCGSNTQVLTFSAYANWAYDGDLVRCTECYCLGHIDCDSESCAWIEWPDDICAKCYRNIAL